MSRSFPGSTVNRYSAGNPSALDIAGTALTLFAWIRRTGDGAICGKRRADGSVLQYELRIASGKIYMLTGNGGGSFDDIFGATTVSTSVWHAVAGVRLGTGANTHKVYLDGVEDASESSTVTMATTAQNFLIGQMGEDTPSAPFPGLIAEVAVWDAALTAGEIMAVSKGINPLLVRPQSLKGYWPLSGATNERDYSGKGSHLTVSGTVSVGDRNPPVQPFMLPTSYEDTGPTVSASYTDSATVYIDIQASGSESQTFGFVDAATVLVDIQASGVDSQERTDSATVLVDLQASGSDVFEHIITDAATVYIDMTPGGFECYSTWSGDFLGEGEAYVSISGDAMESIVATPNPEWSMGIVSAGDQVVC